MNEKFFTTEQVANILQVHPFTILKFIKQGKLKGIKLGRVYRIKESEINKFLEDRMTPSAKRSGAPLKSEEAKAKKEGKETPKEDVHCNLNKKDDDNHYYII